MGRPVARYRYRKRSRRGTAPSVTSKPTANLVCAYSATAPLRWSPLAAVLLGACNRFRSANARSAQVNIGGVMIKPCRFVSSRGHIAEPQKRNAIGRPLIVETYFAFE
jgi:hypothetical protein